MSLLREYRARHDGKHSPLLTISQFVSVHGSPSEHSIQSLSKQTGLPEASVRGAATYYTDLHEAKKGVRVCTGTSCILAQNQALAAKLRSDPACRKVYCLGFCHQSPAVLHPDDTVTAPYGGQTASTSIRSTSRETIVTHRIGRGDFSNLRDALDDGAYETLRVARSTEPRKVLQEVIDAGERGRGGAGFPTGVKWKTAMETPSDEKYVVANGDEGDPGSFIDRLLMENDPHAVLEGMAICAHAIGATKGFIYIRSEYPRAQAQMERAIVQAHNAGYLAPFEVSVFPGMGSYVCGEETALLNAIEGFRGEVRLRPPYPATEGLFGKPTVVNNVETLVNIPWILKNGARSYRKLGTKDSPGTKALCLNHGFGKPGVVEVEFGGSLNDFIEKDAGGSAPGTEIAAVLMGGPMGSVLFPDQWDLPICYAAMATKGFQLGHGGFVAIPKGTDFRALITHLLEFMVDESCGKCVPCRLGSLQALKMAEEGLRDSDLPKLRRLLEVIKKGSLCAFGQLMPVPVEQMLK